MPEPRLIKIILISFNALILLFVFLFLLLKDNTKSKKNIAVANSAITILIGLLFMQCGIYIYAQHIEPNWIKVERVSIRNNKFGKKTGRLKIVHISDLHIKKNGFRERDMVRKITRIRPDIILITGDFITGGEHLKAMSEVLSQLKAAKGIYGVLGDNDFSVLNDILEFKILLENCGVKILDNEGVRIPINKREGLWIIGLTKATLNDGVIQFMRSGVAAEEPKIILSHYPEVADSWLTASGSVDLVLSGGTHGGQIGLSFIRDFFKMDAQTKYIAGLFYVNGVPLYVNRGIGSVGDMQSDTIRFFCRPEITLFSNGE